MAHRSSYDLLQLELHPRVRLVYELLRRYPHAVPVVLDRLAALQAVQYYLEAVVQVRTLAVVIDLHPDCEQPRDEPAPVLVALQVKGLLVVLQPLLLRQ